MSMLMVAHVREKSQSRSSARTLLLDLAIYANDCCGVAWPADATLRQDTNVSHQRIHELKNALEETGELVIVERPGTTNLYYIAWKGVPLGPQGDYAETHRGEHEPSCPLMEGESGVAVPPLWTPQQARQRVRRRVFERRRQVLAFALIKRDGYRCQHPGCDITEDLVIDHIIPLSKGGTDALDNLQWLCRPHNRVKADRDEEVPYAL